MASDLGVVFHLLPDSGVIFSYWELHSVTAPRGHLMILSAHERAHARDDHSACGADTDCHRAWLGDLAEAGEALVIQEHTNERHDRCSPSWCCHQEWLEATREVQPLEADGGGRIEAVVQHHMRGFVEQDLHHHNGVHPQVLEIRKGDILLLPSRTGTDLEHPSRVHTQLANELGAEAVYTSRLLTQPFILRKADDE